MGYSIKSDNILSLETFLNKTFPNLNILKILQVVERNFTKTTNDQIYRNIEFNSIDKSLLIDYNNNPLDIDSALVFVRQFFKIKRTIEIDHTYCILPLSFRGKGLVKPVFQESLMQYLNCGAKRIRVHAALNGGGYVWAKYGFRAINRQEVNTILIDAQKKLSSADFFVVEKIYKGYYKKYPNGESFPINLWAALDFMKPLLLGSNWNGMLDLKNILHLEKFKDYVHR